MSPEMHRLPLLEDPRPLPPFVDRTPVLVQMLSMIDSLTAPGQRHMMTKVLGLIAEEASRVPRGTVVASQRMIVDQLNALRKEAERSWPDPAAFCRRAESVIALLEAAALAAPVPAPLPT
jgi:hypothetical protein